MPRPLYPRDNTVLIVEDDRDDATIMARALQTFGAERPSIVGTGEAEWLQESIASSAEIVDAFCRYLHACFDSAPERAAEPEAELVRRFGERGSSPQEVTLAYQAVLRVLSSESGVGPPLNPTVCLARILARLLEEYQRRLFAIEGKEEAA